MEDNLKNKEIQLKSFDEMFENIEKIVAESIGKNLFIKFDPAIPMNKVNIDAISDINKRSTEIILDFFNILTIPQIVDGYLRTKILPKQISDRISESIHMEIKKIVFDLGLGEDVDFNYLEQLTNKK